MHKLAIFWMETQLGFSTLTVSHLQPASLAEHVGRTLFSSSLRQIRGKCEQRENKSMFNHVIRGWGKSRRPAVKWSNLSFSSIKAQPSLSAAQILLISMCMKRSTALGARCLRTHAATWVWWTEIGLKSWTFMHSLTIQPLVAAGLAACLSFLVLCCTFR